MTQNKLNLDRVLIVDDDPILSAIVQSFFQKRGVDDVHSAADGREALEIVDRLAGKIDFVLCDLNMPEMDGLQFLRHLNDRHFGGQVAILSGEQDTVVRTAERLAHAHSLNVVGSLGKPLKLNELEELTGRLVSKGEGQSPSSPLLATVHDLKIALESDGVVPFYQPKIDIETRGVSGAEALVRWIHPEFGVIGPNFFLPMAEDGGLMPKLTDHVIATTIANMLVWKEQRVEPKVSVNLCEQTVNDIQFPDSMLDAFKEAGLSPEKMVFEVTERHLASRNTHASEVLARLRMMGFGISIDDFGTGYSNIERLREFPFTELKIDQSFVRDAANDQFASASVEASVILGKQLDLRIVAEGVETEEHLNYVADNHVDEVQGYYYAKPMPADEFLEWVHTHEGRVPLRQSNLSEFLNTA